MMLDWYEVLGAVVIFFGGAAWIGRLHSKIVSHEKMLVRNAQAWETNAADNARVQRCLGRIEGQLSSLLDVKKKC